MTWTAPMTAVSGNVLSASQFNTYVRNNLNETAVAKATEAGRYFVGNGTNNLAARKSVSDIKASQVVITAEGGDGDAAWLPAGGPSVSVVTGTAALVMIGANMANETADRASGVGFQVTGATQLPLVINEDGRQAVKMDGVNGGTAEENAVRNSLCFLETRLNAGTNAFTMKYQMNPAGNAYYSKREIIVMPL